MTWADFLDHTALCLTANKGKEQLILHCIKEEEDKGGLSVPPEKEGMMLSATIHAGERACRVLNEMLCIGLTTIDMAILARVLESNELFTLNSELGYSMTQRVSALLRTCSLHNNNSDGSTTYCSTDAAAPSLSIMAEDVILQCLALDESRRPMAQDLVHHPFFSIKEGEKEQIYDTHLEEQAVTDYFNSRGAFALLPSIILRKKMDGLKWHLTKTGVIDRHGLFEVRVIVSHSS